MTIATGLRIVGGELGGRRIAAPPGRDTRPTADRVREAVKRGDTVTWINKDPFLHTVTAAGAFDSRSMVAGASWKYAARKTGDFAYICTLHPNMKGTLKVE